MRIMIFGDVASGKSTISKKLGAHLGLPVLHLDEVMMKLGRDQKAHIKDYIHQEADKADWIIEGNAFTKDKSYRIERADVVIMFAANRFVTLYRHMRRVWRVRHGREVMHGGASGDFKLNYYIPYTLWHFPHRRRQAEQRVIAAGKQIIVVRSFDEGLALLKTFETDR